MAEQHSPCHNDHSINNAASGEDCGFEKAIDLDLPMIEDGLEEKRVKKTRQSFTLHQKIAFVMEFKRDCGIDEKGAQQSRNIRTWLKNKNAVHDIHIAYSTFYRWYQAYGKMNEKQAEKTSICQGGSYKKLRRRPFHDLETVLLQFLRIRNNRLTNEGKPLSTGAFIRQRAEQFYIDLYGSDHEIKFKCSSGWVSRFTARYKYILNPSGCERQKSFAKDGENSFDEFDIGDVVPTNEQNQIGDDIGDGKNDRDCSILHDQAIVEGLSQNALI